MAKTGDIVRFLNSVGGGRIARINGQIAYVVDDDGFEIPMLINECVVVAEAGTLQASAESAWTAAGTPKGHSGKASKNTEPVAPVAPVVERVMVDEIPVEETEQGEKLNIVLGFEPRNSREVSKGEVDMILINDSNYYLDFTLMTRPNESSLWTLRYAGTVEPNIELFLQSLVGSDLSTIDRIAFQYVAYKRQKDFALKNPGSYEGPIDSTRFFRLHCYKPHLYFEKEVIAIDLVKDDKVCGKEVKPDPELLTREMTRKKSGDRRPIQRRRDAKPSDPVLSSIVRRNGNILEVDLHISELVDTTAGLSNADMLNLQIDTFRKVMDDNRNNKGQRIVFIHGKGEGVLRKALMKELANRYKGNDVQDASFREYGFGATQVTIR